jgi:acyl carrier protein
MWRVNNMLDKKDDVRTELEEVIRTTLQLSPEKEIPDENLFTLLEIDSLAALEVLVCIEQKFNIQIPDEDLNVSLLSSLNNMEQYILSKK